MCGRFEFKTNIDDLEKYFRKHIGKLHIDYDPDTTYKLENIAPTDLIHTIVLVNGEYKVLSMKWAIRSRVLDHSKKNVPGQEPYIEKDIFNSRIETVKISPQWKSLIQNYRCIVPMTAFYEWVPANGKKKPLRIYIENEDIFFAGGIYVPQDLKKQTGASILTCEPNKFMKEIHNRMPVLFTSIEASSYLNAPKDTVAALCEPLDDNVRLISENAKI
jgi:putative SOS response-associated peptidase YedK